MALKLVQTNPNKEKDTWLPVFEGKGRNRRVIPNLKLRALTGVLYVRIFRAGRGQMTRSTGFTLENITKAKTFAEHLIGTFNTDRNSTIKKKRVEIVCDELFASLKRQYESLDEDGHRKRRQRTFDQDRTYIPILKKYFGDVYIDQIDSVFWDNWVDEIGRGENRLLGDIGKYVSKLLTFAEMKRYIRGKPTIKNPDGKRSKKAVIYDDEDISIFYSEAEPLLKDMMILNVENPFRPHETAGLRWAFVSFLNDETVVIRLPEWFCKIKDGRELQVSQQAAEMLKRRYRENRNESPYVFPGIKNSQKPLHDVQISRMWRRMITKVNKNRVEEGKLPFPMGRSKGLKFHWLRHTFYTKALLDANVPIAKVSEAGGTSIATLQANYLKSNAKRTAEVSRAVTLKITLEPK